MFGGDDDFGDKSSNTTKQTYGRNQQYGRGSNSNVNTFQSSTSNKGGILKFQDDSDSDDNNGIIGGNNNNNQNNNLGSGYGQKNTYATGFSNSPSMGDDRPSTSSKQSVMDKQRDILLNKQKAGFTGNSSMAFNNKPGSGYTYGQNTDGIDFNNLKTFANNNSQQYVPGESGQKGSGLAPISKMNNIVKFNENNEVKNTNVINLEDSDEDDGEKILQKFNQKHEVSQPQHQTITQQKAESQHVETNNQNNARTQADQLLKNLYGDSSEDSENEETAHKKKLEENMKGGVIDILENDELPEEGTHIFSLPGQQPDLQNKQASQNIANQEQQQRKEPLQYQIAENIDIQDMKQFLTRPLPKGLIIQTQIRRDKSGFARFYPKYHVHLSHGQRYLLTGKKRSNNKTSNYLMSMSKTELSKKSAHFLGKVRSNFLGTEFHVYDTGDNPKKCKNQENARKELSGARGPRKMKVLIPDMQPNGDPITIRPASNKEGIFPMLKAGKRDGLLHFTNKPPKWNDSVQAFVLNFNGRVDKPSVKNFQLIDEANDEQILLQFGRVGDDAFNMDISYPFSIVQAFGICLSSFDYKIACE